MKITPLEIHQVRFRLAFRGYDKKEVDSFLDLIAGEYESVIKEMNDLKERATSLEGQLAELRKKEAALNNTLIAAQKVAEEMRQNAQKEAELRIREAELRAEQITREASDRRLLIQREVEELRHQKTLAIERLRALLRGFEKMLDLEQEPESEA